MTFLTEKEIMALLETMDPQDIRQTKHEQLSTEGHRLLNHIEDEIKAGTAIFEAYGREFRQADAKALAFSTHLPTEETKKPDTRKSRKLPYFALSAAAIVILALLVPIILDRWDAQQTRGRSLDIENMAPINTKLVDVLTERGAFLLDLGNQSNRQEHYREALGDFLQAHELAPDQKYILGQIAIVYEKLGDKKNAQLFLEKYEAAEAKNP